jgi:hypothetical protein
MFYKKLLYLLPFIFLVCSLSTAGAIDSSYNVSGTTVFSVTADSPWSSASIISSATINLATAESCSIQIVAVSPAVVVSGVMPDMVINTKGSLAGIGSAIIEDTTADDKEYLTDAPVITTLPGSSSSSGEMRNLGLYKVDTSMPLRYLQLIFNYKAVDENTKVPTATTSAVRWEYQVYIRVTE